jgi:hypothetical protein
VCALSASVYVYPQVESLLDFDKASFLTTQAAYFAKNLVSTYKVKSKAKASKMQQDSDVSLLRLSALYKSVSQSLMAVCASILLSTRVVTALSIHDVIHHEDESCVGLHYTRCKSCDMIPLNASTI